ncbi:MAG: M20 family peptidase, partial [Gemmatimonadetes bacterium]
MSGGSGPGAVEHVAPRALTWLTARRDEMVSLLRELARMESPSRDAGAQRPIQQAFADALGELGFEARVEPGSETGGALVATGPGWREGEPCQLLLGHTDTVWPLGTLADMPVDLDEDAGVLRGPGVFDMKGGLVIGLYALRALAALGVEPRVPVAALFNADEEIGSPESEPLVVAWAGRASRVFVLEPALGEEGLLKTSRRGVGQFRVRVRGRAAHAGLDPGKGASAIEELAHVVLALHALSDAAAGISVNVGEIRGGTRPNVVAAEAEAVVDVRVSTRDQAREIEARVRALTATVPGTRLEIEGGVDRPPMEFDAGVQALWGAAQAGARAMGVGLGHGMSGGASDGNLTCRYAPTLD